MNLTERLRSVVRPSSVGGSAAPERPCSLDSAGGSAAPESSCSPDPPHVRGPGPTDGLSPASVDPAYCHSPCDTFDGEWRESRGERYVVIDRSYPPGHRHGRAVVADSAPGSDCSWPALALLEPSIGQSRVLFIDVETTGLAGGAGTYAFLVGCGWFEGATFKVRQFLLARYGAERGLLEDVAGTAADAGALVTYNGKTFDVPLLETRFLFHRMTASFAGMPHVDILHSARRLWRTAPYRPLNGAGASHEGARASCCLDSLEESILGHVREDDVPGYAIPSRYFQYVRSGDERPLAGVLEHNRLDLLSLALLTARAAQLLEEGADAAQTAREAYGLGCLYLRAGRLQDARACFARAESMESPATATTAGTADSCVSAEALRALAVLDRRSRRYDDAAAAWRRLLALRACPPRFMQEASEALAVHHEHRERDLHLARDLAQKSLRFATSGSRATAVRHRLTRLDRKLAFPRSERRTRPTTFSLFNPPF
jgi:uncharacterized protein YprB with RNaseH-like and TPR domain